ncbi:hypothetical protein BELL_0026g00130 [Botrytis elliptica]|uniref:Uncharacterized protein n=1 Tax=Botrytis elliptica TaxID=278938 RepID=A0A4Z1K6J6_9HELO|nr:hypothetical protein BELL_0026g00130 [Botrytis elliptica]
MKGMPSVKSTLNTAEETQAVSQGMKHFTSPHGGAGRFVASRESHRLSDAALGYMPMCKVV